MARASSIELSSPGLLSGAACLRLSVLFSLMFTSEDEGSGGIINNKMH